MLSACLVVNGPNNTYNVGRDITRTNAQGDSEKWDSEAGWTSTRKAEANIPRQTVWHISQQDSGIKVWRFGFSSDANLRFIDPNAPIVASASFSANGWVTYLVKGNGATDYIVKRADFVHNTKPDVLGTLYDMRGEWRFTAPNGETFAAYDYHLTSNGIVLYRAKNVFTFLPSDKLKGQQLPEGWQFAWVQKGDIGSSRIIVAQRQLDQPLLATPRFEIGFFDIDQGRFINRLEMSLPPRYEKGNFTNKFYLYDTAKGPISIAIEDAHAHVTVRNLRTGEKRIAFERDAGIAYLTPTRTNTGRIVIKAAVGFSDEYIYDAEDFLYSGARVPPAQ